MQRYGTHEGSSIIRSLGSESQKSRLDPTIYSIAAFFVKLQVGFPQRAFNRPFPQTGRADPEHPLLFLISSSSRHLLSSIHIPFFPSRPVSVLLLRRVPVACPRILACPGGKVERVEGAETGRRRTGRVV